MNNTKMKKFSEVQKQKPLPVVFDKKVLRVYTDSNNRYVLYHESLTDPRHTLLVFISDKAKPESYCRSSNEGVFVDFLSDLNSKKSSYRLSIFPQDKVKELIDAIDVILGNKQPSSEEQWNFYFMRAHLDAYLNRETIYVDGRDTTFTELKELVIANYQVHLHEQNVPRSDFYIGITNDVDVRLAEHEAEEDITISKALVVRCNSNVLAVKVEEELGKRTNGFDNGNPTEISHGKPESRYVYLYKK